MTLFLLVFDKVTLIPILLEVVTVANDPSFYVDLAYFGILTSLNPLAVAIPTPLSKLPTNIYSDQIF